jgi:hypothetical protein
VRWGRKARTALMHVASSSALQGGGGGGAGKCDGQELRPGMWYVSHDTCEVRLSVCNSREVRQCIDEHQHGRLSEERARKGDTLGEDRV